MKTKRSTHITMAIERDLPSAAFVCAMNSTSLTPLRQAPHRWRYVLIRMELSGYSERDKVSLY